MRDRFVRRHHNSKCWCTSIPRRAHTKINFPTLRNAPHTHPHTAFTAISKHIVSMNSGDVVLSQSALLSFWCTSLAFSLVEFLRNWWCIRVCVCVCFCARQWYSLSSIRSRHRGWKKGTDCIRGRWRATPTLPPFAWMVFSVLDAEYALNAITRMCAQLQCVCVRAGARLCSAMLTIRSLHWQPLRQHDDDDFWWKTHKLCNFMLTRNNSFLWKTIRANCAECERC